MLKIIPNVEIQNLILISFGTKQNGSYLSLLLNMTKKLKNFIFKFT